MKEEQHPIDRCIACSTCVVYCPVVEASRQYRGPKITGPTEERFRRIGSVEDPFLNLCSNCRNCDISCPAGVPVGTVNMQAKGEHCRLHRPPLRDWILAHGEWMAVLARPFAPIANLVLGNGPIRRILQMVGISAAAPMPNYVFRSFRQRFRWRRKKESEKKVVFFPGCYIDSNDPKAGEDLVWLLEHHGWQVIVPEGLHCCGAPIVSNGFLAEAGRRAASNVRTLLPYARAGMPILTACTSCGLMLRREYRELFPSAEVDEVAAAAWDAGEFLKELMGRGEFAPGENPVSEVLAYHAPCHLRAQGIGKPGLELLEMIPGLRLQDTDAGCCGIAGSYGFKADRYAIAMQVGQDLFTAVRESGAARVVSECGTCRLQITHATGVTSLHPLSVLRESFVDTAEKS